ncbi:hypothetical protein C2G38_2035484 [Gigaspora rosea]|uniref:Uncharacterized protein n=1 Tax=Gigaspora rosea TaxID=44941 RepID=A0A397VLU3_9GLOM|nr:hypothetical protein C2G38_2035484 [Gigaspora rosea]
MEESVFDASADTILAGITPSWIEKFKFKHGIIIQKHEIFFAECLAYSIKLSESLNKAVTSALEDNDPYYELTKIFKNYRHFLPRKVVLGYKLYRMSYLIVYKKCPKQNNEKIEWETLNDFKIENCNDILDLWAKLMIQKIMLTKRAKDYMNLQITWILVGKPAEIGFFDKKTHNIAVICSENTSFTFQNDRKDLIE